MMGTIKELGIKQLNKAIEDAADHVKRVMENVFESRSMFDALPFDVELPEGTYVSDSMGSILFRVPRQQSLIHELETKLKENEIKYHIYDYSKDNGDYDIIIDNPKQNIWSDIRFNFEAKMTGATCKLTQIGTRENVRTVPVYEVTCLEGAEEQVF